jgi:hypothetical protein
VLDWTSHVLICVRLTCVTVTTCFILQVGCNTDLIWATMANERLALQNRPPSTISVDQAVLALSDRLQLIIKEFVVDEDLRSSRQVSQVVYDCNQLKLWLPVSNLVDDHTLLWHIRTCFKRINESLLGTLSNNRALRLRTKILKHCYVDSLLAQLTAPNKPDGPVHPQFTPEAGRRALEGVNICILPCVLNILYKILFIIPVYISSLYNLYTIYRSYHFCCWCDL